MNLPLRKLSQPFFNRHVIAVFLIVCWLRRSVARDGEAGRGRRQTNGCHPGKQLDVEIGPVMWTDELFFERIDRPIEGGLANGGRKSTFTRTQAHPLTDGHHTRDGENEAEPPRHEIPNTRE